MIENLKKIIEKEARALFRSFFEAKELGDENKSMHNGMGLFIRIPEDLSKQFPTKPEETSPPHVSFIFIGTPEKDKMKQLIDVLRKEIGEMPKFEADLNGVGYFNQPNRIVPHIKVSFTPDMRQWKGYLWTVLEKEGFGIADKFPYFRPHATLAFIDDPPQDYVWLGPKPTGKFEVTEIELWGYSNDPVIFKVGSLLKSDNKNEKSIDKS